jgi:hypothetical protein
MEAVILACGHAPNSTSYRNGEPIPACAICACTIPADIAPDLTVRTARCACGAERPSSYQLAFFEYCGEGSFTALSHCRNCGYHEVAHHVTDCSFCDGSGTRIVGRYDDDIVVYEQGVPCQRCRGKGVIRPTKHVCPEFTPRGALDHDRFYCGCHGWD